MIRKTAKSITQVLRQRFKDGEYADGILPSERGLAAEFGVARLTARRAMESMLADSQLERMKNGRLRFIEKRERPYQIGYFYPSLGSWDYEAQYHSLKTIAMECNIKIRPVYYDSWSDPEFTDGVEHVDAVILHPRPNIPAWLVYKLQRSGKHIWVLGYNYSEYGFPSLTFFPEHAVKKLLDYLHAEGFRNMELINITPKSPLVNRRIENWRNALNECDGKGHFWDFSLADGHLPFCELRDIMRRRIQDGVFDMRYLILATTIVGATVFQRAAADLNLFAGKDYSLASIGSEMHAEMNVPSITCIDSANPYPYFRRYLEWIAGGTEWDGPLFWEAAEAELIPGESIIRKKKNTLRTSTESIVPYDAEKLPSPYETQEPNHKRA